MNSAQNRPAKTKKTSTPKVSNTPRTNGGNRKLAKFSLCKDSRRTLPPIGLDGTLSLNGTVHQDDEETLARRCDGFGHS